MDKTELIVRVESIIKMLDQPLDEDDKIFGWNEESRAAMKKFFAQMYLDLQSGLPLKNFPQYFSIARGLDFWGISGGDILNESSRISFVYRRLALTEES